MTGRKREITSAWLVKKKGDNSKDFVVSKAWLVQKGR